MQLSVIIVTYNTCRLTRECIRSIVEHTEGVEYEILVVDNASTDNTCEVLSADRRIRYLHNGENVGFGRANNIGMAAAKGKYFLLLNSDTVLQNNALKLFYDAAEACGERLGALGAVLRAPDGRPTHSYGTFLTVRNVLMEPINRCVLRLLHKTTRYARPTLPEAPMPVEYVTGADMLVPRTVYERTGGFDAQFFMYCEEVDWQRRMADLGLVRLIIPTPEIVHLEGGSDASTRTPKSFGRTVNSTRSRMLYLRKHNCHLTYGMFRLAQAVIYTPVFLTAPYTWRERMQLLKLIYTAS